MRQLLSRFLPTPARHGAAQLAPPPTGASAGGWQAPKGAVAPSLEPALRYPPVDPGLPACSADQILDANSDLVLRLRRVAGGSDEVFDRRYLVPLRALASYVHLLPASSHDHFAGPGGLFRLCLELGFFSAQAAEERIYTPTADVETRHELEPRYKYATYLAGLVRELYRPLSLCTVTTGAGELWPKFLGPLDTWLREHDHARYYVGWSDSQHLEPSGSEASAVIGSILPAHELAWLDSGSPTIVREVFGVALGRLKAGDSIIADVVDAIRSRVLKVDEVTRERRYGALRVGHHLEVHYLDAMRHLITQGRWSADNDSVLRYGTDGLYLLWPLALRDVLQELDARGVRGLPRDPMTVEELLGRSGLLVQAESGRFSWAVVAGDASEPDKVTTALRVREAASLLGYSALKQSDRPYAQYLVVQAEGKPAPVSPASPAATNKSLEDAYSFSPDVMSAQIVASEDKAQADPPLAEADASAAATAGMPSQQANGGPASQGKREGARRAKRPANDPGDGLFDERAQSDAAAMAPATEDGMSETIRRLIKPDELQLVGVIRGLIAGARSEMVMVLADGSVAVAQDVLADMDKDISSVVAGLERRGWLGAIPGAARGARAAPMRFADKRKVGFVIGQDAAKDLGLA